MSNKGTETRTSSLLPLKNLLQKENNNNNNNNNANLRIFMYSEDLAPHSLFIQ